MKTVYNSFGFMASPLELLHPSILIRLAIFRAKQLLGFDFDPYAMYEFTEQASGEDVLNVMRGKGSFGDTFGTFLGLGWVETGD